MSTQRQLRRQTAQQSAEIGLRCQIHAQAPSFFCFRSAQNGRALIDKFGLELLVAHGFFQTANGALDEDMVLLAVGGFQGDINRGLVNAAVHNQFNLVAHTNDQG